MQRSFSRQHRHADVPGGDPDDPVERSEWLRGEAALAPMMRIGQPAEISEVVAFLLSDRASFVNGAEVIVNGGAMVRCFPHPPIEV